MPPSIQRRPSPHLLRSVQQPNRRVIPNGAPVRHVPNPVVRRSLVVRRQRQRHGRPEFINGPQRIARLRHASIITLSHNTVKSSISFYFSSDLAGPAAADPLATLLTQVTNPLDQVTTLLPTDIWTRGSRGSWDRKLKSVPWGHGGAGNGHYRHAITEMQPAPPIALTPAA